MIVTGSYKMGDEGVSGMTGYARALAIAANPDLGTKKGQFVYYSSDSNDYCAEILNESPCRFELCGVGWVDKSKCSLTQPSVSQERIKKSLWSSERLRDEPQQKLMRERTQPPIMDVLKQLASELANEH